MQPIAPVTVDDLLQQGQEALYKVEIYCCGGWKNLSDWAGENYVEEVSVALAGARVAPEPIAGTWEVTLTDEDSIFHPDHPTSLLTGWLVAGRRVMISVGAIYGGVEYYWRRIVGYMEEPRFSIDDRKIHLSGFDYAQQLTDAKLKAPENYWGGILTTSSIATANTYGIELYNENDAMDITGEANNVAGWTPTDCAFTSEADIWLGSVFVGYHIQDVGEDESSVESGNIVAVVADTFYRFQFVYVRMGGSGSMTMGIYEDLTDNLMAEVTGLESGIPTTVDLFFTATKSCNLKIRISVTDTVGRGEYLFDLFTLMEVTAQVNEKYNLPAGCTGVYQVIMDGELVPYGKKDEGWRYDEAGRRLFFDGEKQVEAGTNNLLIYYFLIQDIDDIIADLLVLAGLYDTQAEALAAMIYTSAGLTIDRVWFKDGSPIQKAIAMVNERVNYRFYFNHNGSPVFEPAPTAKAVGFEDFDFCQCHIAGVQDSQNREEIRNFIVIEGEKIDQTEEKESATPSTWKGIASEPGSIGAYGEHTKKIMNHLFQGQDSVDSYATAFLLEFKDPKWYAALTTPINPTPLEIGDTVRWQGRLSAPARQDNYYGAFLYGTRLYGDNGVVIIKRGMVRDIRLTNVNVAYTIEKVE